MENFVFLIIGHIWLAGSIVYTGGKDSSLLTQAGMLAIGIISIIIWAFV